MHLTSRCIHFSRRSGLLLPIEPFSSTMWTANMIAFFGLFVALTIVRKIKNSKQSRLDIEYQVLQTFAAFMLQSTSFA